MHFHFSISKFFSPRADHYASLPNPPLQNQDVSRDRTIPSDVNDHIQKWGTETDRDNSFKLDEKRMTQVKEWMETLRPTDAGVRGETLIRLAGKIKNSGMNGNDEIGINPKLVAQACRIFIRQSMPKTMGKFMFMESKSFNTPKNLKEVRIQDEKHLLLTADRIQLITVLSACLRDIHPSGTQELLKAAVAGNMRIIQGELDSAQRDALKKHFKNLADNPQTSNREAFDKENTKFLKEMEAACLPAARSGGGGAMESNLRRGNA